MANGLATIRTAGEPVAVPALRRKREEIAKAIEATQARLRQLTADLDTIENALRIMLPSPEESGLRLVPRREAAPRGAMVRLALQVLREADGKALSSREVALGVMTARGLNTDDLRLAWLVTRRVGICLAGQMKRGTVVRLKPSPGVYLWAIAGQPCSLPLVGGGHDTNRLSAHRSEAAAGESEEGVAD